MFAWWPVLLESGDLVWLEYVERRDAQSAYGDPTYRDIPAYQESDA